jgi:NAD(P)-dependent dehydrogenase (short-subunit alcohol dehydrogenase family)
MSSTSSSGGRLAGKNAIVTGAAGGIGLETSILFAKEGASVLLADISEPALEKALAKVKQLVPSAVRVETKVSSAAHHIPYTRSLFFQTHPLAWVR